MRGTAIDLTVASRFLDALAEGEPVTFQTFDDSEKKRRELAQVLHGSIDEAGDALQAANQRGAGVFWMVNYGNSKGRKREHVTGVRALFLDLDGAPLEPVLAAGVEPHAVVESSPGKWHVYWLVTGCKLEQFALAQKALAAKFGGDASVNDLPRVMRLPGFLHRKSAPYQSRIERLEPLQPYEFDALVQRLDLNLAPSPRLNGAAHVAPGGRHAHLVKWAAQLNWRGLPLDAVRVALQAENLRSCQPPKTDAEVDAIARDVLQRYGDQHGRDLVPNDNSAADPLGALSQWLVTEEQVQTMKETRLIWRDLIASSHLSVWSAPGNGGKTSLAKFAASELARDFTVLFFQEDASAGDLPALFEHAKTYGYRMLNSTLAGSSPEDQISALRNLARDGAELGGFVMFFDTLKKYVDLMSKGGSRGFFQLMRGLTQRGATVVLLGHTNKHKGVDGKLIFEGVGDVRNDVDELIYIEATDKDPNGVVTLTMRPDKVRCAIREATFTLDTRTMEVRALDHVVDVSSILAATRQQQEDAQLIACFREALRRGGMKHTDLIDGVIKASGATRRRVQDVFDRYCSEQPSDGHALWIETRMRVNNTRHIALKPGGNR